MTTKASFVKNAAAWLILFIVLVLAPLGLALIGHTEESRGFWVEFGVGLGFVGLAMMGLQFVLTARYSKIGAPFGLDELLQFHSNTGYVAWVFIIGHFAILFLADSDFHEFLDPSVNFPRTLALSTALIAITLLVAFTHWREKFGIIYEWWRLSHGFLALLVVFIGTVHIMQVSYYVSEWWQQAIWVTMSVIAIGLLMHNRVWRPLQMKKKPYKVSKIEKEAEATWSITLEADGHDGMPFQAGQFAWITLGDTPFSLQQHPFTISSSPENPREIRFTIKELGDFTSEIGDVEVGTTAFIEGPYGNFTLVSSSSLHNVFVVGGIGVTPAISMLRVLRDRNDQRESTIIFGTSDLAATPFMEELKVMSAEMNLNVVHVLEDAPDDWDGETGYITEELIKKYSPEDYKNCDFYVCGPPPMMDVAETTLSEWGVPVHKLHSERFNIA
jgi:predicted ferric reductase